MYSLSEFFAKLCGLAPIELSYKMIEKGCYDNSGIIADCGRRVNKVLFSLDLSEQTVNRAIRLGADTVVTHHPVIYQPIKTLALGGNNSALLKALNKQINVISMHLNLDIAEGGIDQSLAEAFGGKNIKIIDNITQTDGYGREFGVDGLTLLELKKLAKSNLGSNRVIVYGNQSAKINKCASFCGSGGNDALKYAVYGDADCLITSDAPHHIIKEIVEGGKSMVILTHYSAENFGFNKFYQRAVDITKVSGYYFEDKRFM